MDDIHDIYEYSVENFGVDVTNRYLDTINAGLSRLEAHPELLRSKRDISHFFHFYAVGKHYLVCTQIEDVILVLTVKHAQMELIERLSTLEPDLEQEAALLFQTLKHKS